MRFKAFLFNLPGRFNDMLQAEQRGGDAEKEHFENQRKMVACGNHPL